MICSKMKKVKHKKDEQLAQGHTAKQGESQD